MDKRRYLTFDEVLEKFRAGEEVWYETGDTDEDGSELNTCHSWQYGDTEEDLDADNKYFE